MTEPITIILTKDTLRITFKNHEEMAQFIRDMSEAGLDSYFIQSKDNDYCDLVIYKPKHEQGFFISEHRRIGLLFKNNSEKFYFIQRTGIADECFMDLGPGYDKQIHFNEKIFPAMTGAKLITYPENFDTNHTTTEDDRKSLF